MLLQSDISIAGFLSSGMLQVQPMPFIITASFHLFLLFYLF